MIIVAFESDVALVLHRRLVHYLVDILHTTSVCTNLAIREVI